jgi:hypothetical protein
MKNAHKLQDNVFGSSTTTSEAVPYTLTSTFTKPQNQNYYYNKYHEGILDIAKGFLNSLLNHLVDKTIVTAVVKEMKNEK